jgi:hypothetical protein
MHAQRLGVDGEKLEDVRVNASHRSPMQSALERCSKLITPDLLPELTSILSQLVKRGAPSLSPSTSAPSKFGFSTGDSRYNGALKAQKLSVLARGHPENCKFSG